MKLLYHVAALVLVVGWYLMMPPLESVEIRPSQDGQSYTLDWKTPGNPPPLSVWSTDGSYDTAGECREAKRKAVQTVLPSAAATWEMAECIATDDPRLK